MLPVDHSGCLSSLFLCINALHHTVQNHIQHNWREFQYLRILLWFLARGLGVKVKGRVEKQDCNEQ